MTLDNAEVGEQQGHGLGLHGGAAVGMKGELVALDALALTGLANQLLGETGGLSMRDHPADDLSAEDVENHVEVVIGPLRWAVELGDVPAPELIGASCEQLGRGIVRASKLASPFAAFV